MRRFLLLILISVGIGCEGLIAAEGDWEPFLKVGHIGEINATQFSDDGELIVTGASGDKATKLWDAKSGTMLRTFGGLTRDVTAVAISADKSTIATGDGFDVLVFDAQSGRRLQSVPGNKRRGASGLALSADGKTLYGSFREDSVTHQWDVETGKEVRTFVGQVGEVMDIQLTRDERFLFTSGHHQVIQWDLATGKQLFHSIVPLTGVGSIEITPDGTRLVGGTSKQVAYLWDLKEGKQLQIYLGNAKRASISDDARYVATVLEPREHHGSVDGILWDAVTWKELRRIRREGDSVSTIELSGDGKQLVAAFSVGGLVSYDVETGAELHRFAEKLGRPEGVNGLKLAGDDGLLALAAGGRISCWDLRTGKKINALGSPDRYLFDWKLSDDGQLLAIASETGCKVWNVQENIVHCVAGSPEERVKQVAFRPEESELVTMSATGQADVRDVSTGKILRSISFEIPEREKSLELFWMTAHARYIIATYQEANRPGVTRVWDVNTSRLLRESPFLGSFYYYDQNADGQKVLLTHGLANAAHLWNVETGKLIRSIGTGREKHATYMKGVDLSADEKLVATGSYDGVPFVWDAATGDKLQEFKGHTSSVGSVRFSADSRYLLTGSADGSARIWDRASATELLALHVLDAGEDWVAFTPDGYYDGSPRGMRALGHRRRGTNEVQPADIVAQRYHVPGLLAKVWLQEKFRLAMP